MLVVGALCMGAFVGGGVGAGAMLDGRLVVVVVVVVVVVLVVLVVLGLGVLVVVVVLLSVLATGGGVS